MLLRQLAGGLIATAVTCGAVSACTDDTSTCDDLRQRLLELERTRAASDATWLSVEELAADMAETIELRAEILRQCI